MIYHQNHSECSVKSCTIRKVSGNAKLLYVNQDKIIHARAALAWTKKKRSLRNGNLKQIELQTEEQRKERLRIGCEKDRARTINKILQEEKKRSSETEDHEKQRLATLKRLKRSVGGAKTKTGEGGH